LPAYFPSPFPRHFLTFFVQESPADAFLHRGTAMRNSKAARSRLFLLILGMPALFSVASGRAAAQQTPPSSPAGETRCAIPNGRSYRDVPCPPAGGRPASPPRGARIQPRSSPGSGNTPPPDPAAAEISQGDYLYNSGNLEGALWHYQQALAAHPNDASILSRIEGTKTAIQNAEHDRQVRAAAAARQREAESRDQYAASREQLAAKFQGILGEDFNASFDGNRQSAVLSESLPVTGLDFTPPSRPLATAHTETTAGLSFTNPGPVPAVEDKSLFFPLFRAPIAADSPPAKVLLKNQTEVEKLDEQIRRAQEALRRLIETNKAGDEQRLEWEKESDEATIEAEKLPLKLVIDLIGAHVDYMQKADEAERKLDRAEVLDMMLSRGPEDANSPSLHNIYGMLLQRNQDLERVGNEVRLAGKLNDLREKIKEFSVYKDTSPSWDNAWDVITSFKKVEEMAGPSKDLLDSAYTISQQAVSLEHLAQIEGNNEKILAAQAGLQKLIRQLVLKKQAAKARAAAQKTQTTTEAHP
jgi:hypothetical protein